MRILGNISIRAKLKLVAMTTSCVALALACLAFSVYDQFAFRTELVRNIETRAQIIGHSTAAALTFGDPKTAEEGLTVLAADVNVLAAAVYDAKGKLFATYRQTPAPAAFPDSPSHVLVAFVENQLEVYSEVILNGQLLGKVFLRVDPTELHDRLQRNVTISLLVLLCAAGVAYVMASRLEGFISRPLSRLAQAAQKVAAQKDYSIRVPKLDNDEVGQVNDAFNDMLAQIQERDAALECGRWHLEQRIDERTRELSKTNEQLLAEVDASVCARQESEQLRTRLETAYQCLQREVEERAGAQEALRRSEERFSKAFRSIPVPLAIVTRKTGEFVDVNDAFGGFVGVSREWVIGQSVFDLPLAADAPNQERLREALESGAVLRAWECRFKNPAGAPQVVLISTETLRLGNEPCVLLMVEDATSRVSLEQQLRQAQKMDAIGQLASGVAHDFNNLLTVIQGHTQLVLSAHAISTKSRDSLTKVATASQRASQLTRQLLTFSRKQFVQLVPNDLNQIVANVRMMLEPLLGEAVKLRWTPSVELPFIEADPGMVEQVIVNLAVNARDAMPGGGELTLTTWACEVKPGDLQLHPQGRAGRFVCLTVRDTGSGIDPQTMEHIFEPFFTTKGVGKGTGLGLATVYGIVKQHQGWIEVASEPGVGTTFSIFFPEATAPATTLDPVVVEGGEVGGGKETILVVEDEPALRELVSHILRDLGYDVMEAVHGKEALKVWDARSRHVDLLLTDMMMPEGITGSELATRLRQEAPELKVVYTSGYSPELVGRDLQLQPGLNFLPKPYNPRTLARTVRECLDRN